MMRNRPSVSALDAIGQRYPLRLFEMAATPLWIVDLGIVSCPDRTVVRLARAMVRTYVDAVRVLNADDHDLEQLSWLVAAAEVARVTNEPTLGLVSDDGHFDFATLATPDGITTIGDHVAPYLLRWDDGELTVQPYIDGDGAAIPRPPEELDLLASVSILPAEPLPGGSYPIHGNVTAEIFEFAPLAAGIIGESAVASPSAALRLLDTRGGLASSCWDG